MTERNDQEPTPEKPLDLADIFEGKGPPLEEHATLLKNIKANLDKLEPLLADTCEHWTYEDKIYRFYHHSFKVYYIQDQTLKIVELLRTLGGGRPLNERFMNIVRAGTGRTFSDEDNRNWEPTTRPMLEAFFHAKYFLEMACKYGRELETAPNLLPSGWASVLYLYNMR